MMKEVERDDGLRSCAVQGGCPSDYIAISIAIISFVLLLSRLLFPFLVHKIPRTNGSGFWIPVIQVFGSSNLLLSIVMSINFLKFEKSHWWQSCYVWAVWIEGPLGFGLLLSCRIAQAFHLHHIFVKRQLPPIRSYFFLPLILLPWVAGAVCKCFPEHGSYYIFESPICQVQLTAKILSGVCFPSWSSIFPNERPLNNRCHMGTHWIIPVVCLHTFYVAALVGFTGAIRHIEFRFNELKDLWQGILVSSLSIGIWSAAYILNEIHDDVLWLQVASRFLLLITASIMVLVFFSISSSQPLLSQISLRKREPLEFQTMGQALGIPDSGLLLQIDPLLIIDPNEPLDKLLLNKRFCQSFMAFADSCLAGESVHFYNEVHERDKISADDPVRRIYMARHIIEKYIVAGAAMEVNISYRTRQEILTTTNLAHPDLFINALNELMQLMKTNLAKDYWSSMFFIKFKEEANMRFNGHELESMTGLNFSPRLSSVHGADDPFHQEHVLKGFGCDNHDLDAQ